MYKINGEVGSDRGVRGNREKCTKSENVWEPWPPVGGRKDGTPANIPQERQSTNENIGKGGKEEVEKWQERWVDGWAGGSTRPYKTHLAIQTLFTH